MPEATTGKKIAYVDPFFARAKKVKQPALNNKFMQRVVSMDVDKETLSSKPVFEKVDVEAEIQACKDLCGLDYMKKLLASGKVSPQELQDDAGASVDLTKIPATVHEAKAQANAINETVGKVAKSVGAEDGQVYNSREIEAMITSAVAKQFEAQKAAAPTKEG